MNPQTSTVLVTGATGFLGQVVARKLVEGGHHVVGTWVTEQPAERPGMTWLEMDVTKTGSVRAALPAAGMLGGLVHCVGGFRHGAITTTTDDDLDFLVDVNLRSAMIMLREVLPAMLQTNNGRVVFVGSLGALHPGANTAAYAATKAGLHALVQAVAAETKDSAVTINAVLPSMIDTPPNRASMPQADTSRWVTPEQVADAVLFLLSPGATAVRGALLPVPNGM